MTAVLEFECHRPVKGYQIVPFDQHKLDRLEIKADHTIGPSPDMTDGERRVLNLWGSSVLYPDAGEKVRVIHLVVPEPGKVEHFDLYDRAPGTFLEFAHTAMTHRGVKVFADRFGSIWGSAFAERVEYWYSEIRRMGRAVAAWETAKTTGDFRNIVRIIEKRANYRDASWDPEVTGVGANVFLRADRSTGAAHLSIRPSDFLDALWVQLVLAIDGRQNFRSCSECRNWFPIESGGNRSDKVFCSDACRMRAYRKRRKPEFGPKLSG